MSKLNPDDWFRGSNDSAYEMTEERTGVPLDYVAEKLRKSVEASHQVLNTIGRINQNAPTDAEQVKSLQMHALLAFQYGLTSYLALMNMLALANESNVFERLAHYSREEFRDWLSRIQQQGSVTG